MIEQLIEEVYALKQTKESLETQINELKEKVTTLDTNIDDLSNKLLEEMKAADLKVSEQADLVADIFSRETVGYTSDKDVIDYLKANGYEKYIKTKVTESLDKTPLKKALKTDGTLAEALKEMTIKTINEYVVVTTKENHQKMLEHIESNK